MQLNVMPLSELLTTANNYAASIKELGIYSDLVKELCIRLDAGSIARREITKQRDALAAENAALKHAGEIIRHLNANREEANFCGIDDCHIDEAVDSMITPATDAFLREVKAQGAESAAAHIKQHIQHIPEDLRVTYHDVIELCAGAAAALRKGGAA